ncbi:uncharacterized protein LOC133779620 [Humulus lupulus]|uniref:uncharacterized protein LOC133779620 n=1 Tax=Humulus lupulus TaxID=3486 RepID=UPI002B4154EA|nr:uncharacterized protein LOC133779620 [Humulus lupulus]
MEQLGDSIYFEENGGVPGLYVIQYIPSSINWKLGQVVLNEKVDHVIFLSITKNWSPGDIVTLQLPITIRTDPIKDDRPEYASIQAILYGPYLLVAHSSGDWDIKTGSASASSSSDWITPIPSSYNDYVVCFSQDHEDSTLILTNSNNSITMEKLPESGTDSSLKATFRLILTDSPSSDLSTTKDMFGKSVMLEPYDFPSMVVVQQGEENDHTVTDSSNGKDSSSLFHMQSSSTVTHKGSLYDTAII